MGLKCSVLGHRFGQSAVEREREEQGSEVVITIRELETCERCGHTRTVSENKEVTTVETPDDVDAHDVPDADSGTTDDGPDERGDAAAQADPAESGADIVDAESGEPTLGDDGTFDHPSTDDPHTVEEDDAVILDDSDGESPPDGEREPGEWPAEPEEDDDDWAPDTTPADGESPEQSVDPIGTTVMVPDGEFRCTECSFATPVESSSLRAGDFCPECHRGTLVHEDDVTRKE